MDPGCEKVRPNLITTYSRARTAATGGGPGGGWQAEASGREESLAGMAPQEQVGIPLVRSCRAPGKPRPRVEDTITIVSQAWDTLRRPPSQRDVSHR